MAPEWTEDLTVGVEKIDSQHRELFKRINSLRTALRDGSARDETEKTLEFLEQYVQEHFAMEENYMRKYGYHGIMAHRTEHEGFVKDLNEYKAKWKELNREGEITSFLEIEMERRFSQWLADHIGRTDKAMGEFILKKE